MKTTKTTTQAFCDSCDDLTEVKQYTTTEGTLLLCEMCAN